MTIGRKPLATAEGYTPSLSGKDLAVVIDSDVPIAFGGDA